MTRFSQRSGHNPGRVVLQVRDIDLVLRTKLWNLIHVYFLNAPPAPYLSESKELMKFYWSTWHNFFNWAVDGVSDTPSHNDATIRKWFFAAKWFEVYDLIEFLSGAEVAYVNDEEFVRACNIALEQEMAGYRIVDRKMVEITNENELEGLQTSLKLTKSNKFGGAHAHLKRASELAFDRKSPDFRNSIKESISAVESVAKVISNNTKADLSEAIRIIDGKKPLHEALKKGFVSLYGYTSDAGGIRHALTDSDKCDFDEAKYMLLACSAFVSFLVAKST